MIEDTPREPRDDTIHHISYVLYCSTILKTIPVRLTHTHTHTRMHTHTRTQTHAGRQAGRQAERQRGRGAERQRGREAGMQAHTHTHTVSFIDKC